MVFESLSHYYCSEQTVLRCANEKLLTRSHGLVSAPNIKSFNIKNFRLLAIKRQTEHQNKLPGNSSLNVSLVFPVFPVCPVCSVHDHDHHDHHDHLDQHDQHDHHDCHVHIYTQVGGYMRKLEAIWPEVRAQTLQSLWIDNHQSLSQSVTYVGRYRAARAAKNNFDVPFKCAFVGFFSIVSTFVILLRTKERYPEKKLLFFWILSNWGGGAAQFFCHLFIRAFLVNKRSQFPSRGQ